MCRLHTFVTIVLMVLVLREIEPSKDVMKHITSGFVKVLDECRHQLNLTDQIMLDLFHFWRQDYSLLNRDTGCAIICMSKKLDLMDSNGRLHHGNAQDFAMSRGADSEIASRLVTIIHDCENQHEGIDDECLRVLEVAKCFRSGLQELNWTPNVEVILEEVLTEI